MNSISEYIKSQNIQFDETLNVDELLKGIRETDINDTQDDIVHILKTIYKDESIIQTKNKLKKYRLINDVYQLNRGKHVRWIKKDDQTNKLNVGGIVVDIKFYDNGTHVLILNKYLKRNFQIHFDKVFIFQKLSFEEEVILELKRTI
jgi:hypothetical protein